MLDTFHFSIFQLTFVSTPSGTVITQSKLTNAIQSAKSVDNAANNIKSIQQGDGTTLVQISPFVVSCRFPFLIP